MSLYIKTMGHGPAIVFIHGWAMNGLVWQAVARQLATDFRVHCLDLPGHGESDAIEPYTIEQIVTELDLAFPSPVHVLGWSLGATIAVQWAVMQPQKIRSLTLIAYNPCFVQRADWLHGMTLDVLTSFSTTLQSDWKEGLKRFIGLQAMGDRAIKSVARSLFHCLSVGREPALAALESGLVLLHNTDQRPDLVQLTCPIMLCHGGKDGLIPVTAARWLANTIQCAQLVIYPHAAHAPFVSCQAEFVQDVRRFLFDISF